MDNYLLDVCVDSMESAEAALNGGADRLTVCAELPSGGITPGINLFYGIKMRFSLPTGVLLRPRRGDFCYTPQEFLIMKKDAAMFRDAGAEFLTFGVLNPDGSLDVPRMDELMLCVGKTRTMMGRAFDFCRNPMETADQVKMLGMKGIVTSGQQKDCYEGRSLIAQLVLHCSGLEIVAAGDTEPKNIKAAAKVTGAHSFQITGIKETGSAMRYRKKGITTGLSVMNEYSVYRTDEASVAGVKRALYGLSG